MRIISKYGVAQQFRSELERYFLSFVDEEKIYIVTSFSISEGRSSTDMMVRSRQCGGSYIQVSLNFLVWSPVCFLTAAVLVSWVPTMGEL